MAWDSAQHENVTAAVWALAAELPWTPRLVLQLAFDEWLVAAAGEEAGAAVGLETVSRLVLVPPPVGSQVEPRQPQVRLVWMRKRRHRPVEEKGEPEKEGRGDRLEDPSLP